MQNKQRTVFLEKSTCHFRGDEPALVKRRPGRLTSLFFMGALLGGVAFLFIYGFRILDVTYIDRMLVREGVEDLPQHYLGWEFFRRSAWSFPFGNIEGLIYPETVSVVYTDSIPLFAVFFKLFSTFLPANFQYFGIFTLICFLLQGGFAALICDSFFKNTAYSLVLSFFFILSPIMLRRTFYHSALTAHFLILAAFTIWMYKSSFTSWKTPIVLFALLNALTVTIAAYFTPMTLGVMLCYALQELIERKKRIRVLLLIIVSVLAILGTAWLFGYFSGDITPASQGLGNYSFNLNGFFNPLWYSGIFKSLPMYAYQQEEGFAYLGAGTIFLLSVTLVLLSLRFADRIKKTGKINLPGKLKIPYFVMALVFTALAVSPVITFQDKLLFTIPLPEIVRNMLSVFRSSGRLIWPVYYAVFIFAVREISTYYQSIKTPTQTDTKKQKSSFSEIIVSLVIVSCLFLQVYDIAPLIAEKKILISSKVEYRSVLNSPLWDQIAKTHKLIYIYKPSADLYNDYTVQSISLQFDKFALDQGMGINVAYLSRDVTKFKDNEITAHFDTMAKGAVYNDYIYIFMNPDFFPGDGYGLHYYKVDGIVIGVNTPIEGIPEYKA